MLESCDHMIIIIVIINTFYIRISVWGEGRIPKPKENGSSGIHGLLLGLHEHRYKDLNLYFLLGSKVSRFR